jgi:hypothetical protein
MSAPIVVALVIVGGSSAALVLAALVSVLLDRRRARRGGEAGLEALRHLEEERKRANAREVVEVRLELVPNGAGWRWLVWDASPAYDEQIEGVLVPYSHGWTIERAAAERQARSTIRVDDRAVLVELVIREPRP